jgi:hypothetical protein
VVARKKTKAEQKKRNNQGRLWWREDKQRVSTSLLSLSSFVLVFLFRFPPLPVVSCLQKNVSFGCVFEARNLCTIVVADFVFFFSLIYFFSSILFSISRSFPHS